MNTAAQRLRQALLSDGMRGALLSAPDDVCWITDGFSGVGLVLVTCTDTILVTDPRWSECTSPCVTLRHCQGSLIRCIALMCRELGLEGLYVRQDALTVSRYDRLKTYLDGEVALLDMGHVTEQLRSIKQPHEIGLIREACRVTCGAFHRLIPMLKPGITQREAARQICSLLFSEGADGLAFSPNIAFGEHTALSHAVPSQRRLTQGDAIQVDMGCTIQGYAADFTRMLCLGTPSPQLVHMHGAVLKAQDAARAVLQPGNPARQADLAARRTLSDMGCDNAFVHALGHGLGLRIHEMPSLSAASRHVLQCGMTMTIEPSVTAEGLGVRLQDTVLLTQEGSELLTDYPRDLIIL